MKKNLNFKRVFAAAAIVGMSAIQVAGLLPGSIRKTLAADLSISHTVSNMTIEQKVGQMIMPAFRKWTDANGNTTNVTELNESIAGAIKNLGIGGVCLFAENSAGTEQTAALAYDMQQAADIPLLLSIDQEGGYIVRLGTGTSMCGNMALGATDSTDMVYTTGNLIGSELSALGINIDFAPDMDVNNNPANPVIGVRSFSSNPLMVAKLGTAYIEGLHSENIITAIKHFPGHGDTGTDSHTGLPSISKTYDELKNFELVSFQAGIDAGTDMIMTAHIQFPEIEKETYISKDSGEEITLPATLSKTIITDILRTDMGYNGVVCTDAMGMDAIEKNFNSADAARLAINAGVDILLMPVTITSEEGIAQLSAYIDTIVSQVKSGAIEETTINSAVERILRMKMDRGILNMADLTKDQVVDNALKVVGSKEHHETEMTIAKNAITMVKNDNVLPVKLTDGEKVVILCAFEDDKTSVEYAVSRLKANGVIPANATVEIYGYEGKNISEFQETIKSASVVLATTYMSRTSYLDSSSEKDGWQSTFMDACIDYTHSVGKKIAVISTQLPYDLARYQKADALLASYNGKGMKAEPVVFDGETKTYGPNMPAAFAIAFGEMEPSGKLPVDIMKLDDSSKYTSEVLYQSGFGITDWQQVESGFKWEILVGIGIGTLILIGVIVVFGGRKKHLRR